eukprot:2289700-Pyramimonas_sp.AAC.1
MACLCPVPGQGRGWPLADSQSDTASEVTKPTAESDRARGDDHAVRKPVLRRRASPISSWTERFYKLSRGAI